MLYETTVDAQGNWAICEEGGGDVIADLMTEKVAEKICNLLNDELVDIPDDLTNVLESLAKTAKTVDKFIEENK